ncbi:MAG: hypothetical protein KHZ82_04000, partial [Peptoniphilus harei]|nr:hypothetical protein [Peptoniphilus harei]
MKIKITDDALKYLSEKNASEVTVDYVTSKQCCGSGMPSSDTYISSPRRSGRQYEVFEKDDLKIINDGNFEHTIKEIGGVEIRELIQNIN